jgi:hypothetical protein
MKKAEKLLRLIPVFIVLGFVAGCGGHASAPAMSPAAPVAPPAPGPGSATPSNATQIPDIQKLGGWQHCTAACTNTPTAVFSLAQGIASPSQSGASARFQLLPGTRPFGGALWFKNLGTANNATHFVYDLSFYMDNPSAPQALEFNVSQSAGGSHYDFSTQCDLVGQRVWRVWDPVKKSWAASSVPCVQPPPNTWNHLVWEFERSSSGQVVFSAVTLNGNRGEVNMIMPHTADAQSGIDIAFQADANQTATPFSVWLDKITLTYW